ncbi:MAG TPA: Sec-independent protein translocase protein TatB [Aestuariivirgaceae bacterium]|nr:Sec-independent protein translocase protein TatB [Aestuariivirgaceae bacterium]
MFDFGLGTSEILVIAVVALIVIGPKDLPRLLRTVGQYMRKIQGMAREFQNHLNEAAKEAGIDDVKKEVKGMTNFTVTADLDKQGSEIKRAIEQSAPKPAVAAPANGAGAKMEPAKPAPAALARPIAATEPVAPAKAKPVRRKAEPKAKPAPEAQPRPKAKLKADPAREAAKS